MVFLVFILSNQDIVVKDMVHGSARVNLFYQESIYKTCCYIKFRLLTVSRHVQAVIPPVKTDEYHSRSTGIVRFSRGYRLRTNSPWVEPDDGTTTYREVVGHHGGVAIVPVLESSVIFVRQYRIAIEREILEIPAGLIEKAAPPKPLPAASSSKRPVSMPEP